MSNLRYRVPDMTCDHCIASVTEEVEKVKGVTGITVDLDTKFVTVSGSNLDDVQLQEAIKEAGYDAESLAQEQPHVGRAESSCCGGCSTN